MRNDQLSAAMDHRTTTHHDQLRPKFDLLSVVYIHRKAMIFVAHGQLSQDCTSNYFCSVRILVQRVFTVAIRVISLISAAAKGPCTKGSAHGLDNLRCRTHGLTHTAEGAMNAGTECPSS